VALNQLVKFFEEVVTCMHVGVNIWIEIYV